MIIHLLLVPSIEPLQPFSGSPYLPTAIFIRILPRLRKGIEKLQPTAVFEG
jgi:hypothetical protein